MRDEKLIQELIDSGVKCTSNEIIFVVKDSDGRFIWLEVGDSVKGLTYIMERHFRDFCNIGVDTKEKLVDCLYELISHGRLIAVYPSNNGEDRVYDLDGVHYVISALGSNGFIVTAYPHSI